MKYRAGTDLPKEVDGCEQPDVFTKVDISRLDTEVLECRYFKSKKKEDKP